jgi:hypothetical protein
VPTGEVKHIRERGAQFIEFHLALDLRDIFVEDIQKVLGKDFLEFLIVGASVVNRLILPFLKPLPQSIRDENAIADSRKALMPTCIFCTWETNVHCRRLLLPRVFEVSVKGFIQVIVIEVPEVVLWKIQLVGIPRNLTKEEDVPV